ncbi:hypothetical protein ACS3SW_16810 [Roseobacteraceae bacterium S113]
MIKSLSFVLHKGGSCIEIPEKQEKYPLKNKLIDGVKKKTDEFTWADFDDWAELFDAVCLQQGHITNAELASVLCKRLGKVDERAHETMLRNIGNWRNATNLPNRGNFRALGEVLNVTSDQVLRQQWSSLYREASNQRQSNVSVTGTQIEGDKTFIFVSGLPWKQSVVLLCICSAIVTIAISLMLWSRSDALDAHAWFEEYHIPWRNNVVLRVGDTEVIHGARGACGELPESNQIIRASFPKTLRHGELDVGMLGARKSAICGGPTPAVEILYKATSPGVDEFVLYGNQMRVRVLSADSSGE